jgi:hypothetical protein
MKRCPTCARTYPDDTLAFCLIDGSVLSASFDPERSGADRGRNSTETQVLNPTIPSDSSPTIQPTIRTPAPQVPPLYVENRPPSQSVEKRSKAPWAIAGVAVLLAGILGMILLVSKWPTKTENPGKLTNSNASTPAITKSKVACNISLSHPIYDKWIQMGGENGRLKCPVDNESDAPTSPLGTTGRWVRFSAGDGGYIIWHESGANAGKAFEVSGCMYKVYASLGGTKSWLGFPTGDGGEFSTGAWQQFEAGYILWDSKTYACQAYRNKGTG